MDLGITQRVALISGGSKGLGFATAQALAEAGCRIALVSRTQADLEKAAAALARDFKAEAVGFAADLSDPASPRRVVEATAKRFGHVDILVNSAGAAPAGSLEQLTEEQLDGALRLKLFGYLRMIRAVLPIMRARKWGRIISIGGMAGRSPGAGFVAVGLNNIGIATMTKSVSDAVAADGILVNAVDPGSIATDRQETLIRAAAEKEGKTVEAVRSERTRSIPLGRMGKPEEVGALIAFLASERAGFLTGASIPIDGGTNRNIF
jgi:3-oxoacyl-[acyl-carrier protein] reductase/bacilysin biosynthesis oxidoreductase BacG